MRTFGPGIGVLLACSMGLAHGAAAQRPTQSAPPSTAAAADPSLPAAPLLRLFYSEWGQAVGVIDSATIARSTAATFSELLQARLPGLRVLRQGGAVTDGSFILLRGPVSLIGSSAPLVLVDGVRVDARQADTVFANGAAMPSRLDDIAPEDIARIEVLTGPAAALYGSGAAAGVILVTTKSGGDDKWRLSGRAESRTDLARDEFPANYRRVGVDASGATASDCRLQAVAAGSCNPTGLDVWNPLEQANQYHVARSGMAHLTLAGKSLGTSVYANANGSDRNGVLPRDDARRLAGRAKLSRALPGDIAISAFGARLHENARRGADGDVVNASAITPNGLFGSAENTFNRGYAAFGPLAFDSLNPDQRLTHTTLGARFDWRRLRWLEASGLLGSDRVVGRSSLTFPNQTGFGSSTRVDDEDLHLTTATARLSAYYNVNAAHALTSVGVERWASKVSVTDSVGTGTLVSQSGTRTDEHSIAISVVQNLAVSNFTMGLSLQRATDPVLSTNWYPGANFSWRHESGLSLVPLLRFHAAYGEAAGAPPSLAELMSWPVAPPFGPAPAKPGTERTKNLDVGVDASVGRGTMVSLTGFHSRAMNLRAAVFGGGFGSSGLLVSTNEMVNEGIEATLRRTATSAHPFALDVALSLAGFRNRVTRFDAPSLDVSSGAVRAGSPLYLPHQRGYAYGDLDHDGIISASEVQLGQVAFLGSPLPTFESALESSLHLPGRLTLGALLDYRHGMSIVNRTAWYRCTGVRNCQAVQDPSASLADQASVVAAQLAGNASVAGFIEDASFLKLRELALRWSVPESWTRLFRSGAEITVAGRNLATATRYRGADPEISSQLAGTLPRQDFARTPIPRELVIRLEVGAAR